MALRNFWILAGVYPVAAYGAGMTESVFNAQKTVFYASLIIGRVK